MAAEAVAPVGIRRIMGVFQRIQIEFRIISFEFPRPTIRMRHQIEGKNP
jgi:hypothetical protein